MADDTTKKGGGTLFDEASKLNATTASTKAVSEATAKAADAQDEFLQTVQRTSRALKENEENLKNVSLAEQQSESQKQKLIAAGKNYLLNLAKEVSLITQLKGAAAGYINTLKSATSLSQHYSRMLDEVDKSQTMFLGSVNASTSGIADSSRELQRHINTLRDTSKSAHEMAGKYKVDIKVIDDVNNQVWGKFGARIMSVGNAQQRWRKISEAAFVSARTAGISTGEAMDFMAQRADRSTKSVEGLTSDMQQLGVVVDEYKEKIKKLGKEALERMAGSTKMLADALMDLNSKFDQGAPSVALYGRMHGELATRLTAVGVAPGRISKDLKVLNDLIGEMSAGDLGNFIGTKVGQKMIEEGGEDLIADPEIKAKFKKQMDAARENNADNLELMRTAIQASQGDIGVGRELFKFREQTMGKRLSREELAGKGMSQAGIHEFEKIDMDKLVEQAKKGEKVSDKKQEKLQELMGKGSTPAQKSYQTVVKIREHTQKIERILSKSLGAAIGVGVGGMAVGGIAAMLGKGGLKSLATKMPGAANVVSKIPGVGALMGGGGGLAAGAATGGIAILIGMTLKHLIDRHGKEIFAQLKDIGKIIWDSLKPVVDVIKMVIGTVSEALKPVADVVGTVIKSALSLIKPAVAAIGGALKSVANALKPVIKIVGGILVPLFRFLSPIIQGLVKVIKVVLTPVIWALSLPFKALAISAKAVGWLFDKLYKYAKPVIDGLRSVVGWVYENVLQPIGAAAKYIWDAIGPTVTKVGKVLWKAGKTMGSIFGKVAKVASKLAWALKPLAFVFGLLSKGLKFLYKGIMWVYNNTVGRFQKTGAAGATHGVAAMKKDLKAQIEEKELMGEDTTDLKAQLLKVESFEQDQKTETKSNLKEAGLTNEDIAVGWSSAKLKEKGTIGGAVPTTALSTMGAKQADRASQPMRLSVEAGGGGEGTVSDARVDDAAGVVEIPMPNQSIKISMRSFSPAVAKMVSDATSRGTFS